MTRIRGYLAFLAAPCLAAVWVWAPRRAPERQTAVTRAPASPAQGTLSRASVSPFPPRGYRSVRPGYLYRFPRDLAAHPDFRTEWWYYTGHLASGQRRFGFELTFFRVGLDPRRARSYSAWALHTIYFAHLAVTDETHGSFHVAESAGRPALGMAGADTSRFRVWINDWSAGLEGNTHRLRATAADIAIDLELLPEKPPIIHGERGISRKSSRSTAYASHYFSIPRLAARGRLRMGREWRPVTGSAWLDREFFSSGLPPHVMGWDWYALQLDDRRELMLYVLRQSDGRIEPASGGTLVEADGSHQSLSISDFQAESTGAWRSPHSGAVYPSGWRIHVPGANLRLTLTPTVADQELHLEGLIPVTYWEGSVRIAGEVLGRPVSGRGYVELTGYARRMEIGP
ncbi:MAG: carotenoid 1,2-hydratase [Armatimonadetes bacterium]|nr:carotenoid 1,2-hydratase [Armatimonadota bacterium]